MSANGFPPLPQPPGARENGTDQRAAKHETRGHRGSRTAKKRPVDDRALDGTRRQTGPTVDRIWGNEPRPAKDNRRGLSRSLRKSAIEDRPCETIGQVRDM